MAYASKAGRARISSKSPQALAICDRCGFTYNHVDLAWQFDWGGASLINKRILVCRPCNDLPQNQLRAIVLPADPVPIMNPRTENFAEAETTGISISAPTVYDPITGIPIPQTTGIVTQDGNTVTTQVIGNPTGLTQNAIMPLFQGASYGVTLNPLSVSSQSGTSTITVTFSSAHGLSTNAQIAVQGLSNNAADGIYSITVTNPMIFTYQVNSAIPVSSLLQGTTLMVTALVGLPYDYTQIPLTGA
jgi:hypothetical protein